MYKNQLIKLRERKELKQYEIANYLNIYKGTYNQYETEYFPMPIKYLISVCNYFNVSLDYIFEFTNKVQYDNAELSIDNKKAGARLKEFRKDNNLTLEELGKILNCSYGTIAGYESGRYLIPTSFLYELCDKYKISADYLVGKIDKDPIKTKTEDIIENILNVFDSK